MIAALLSVLAVLTVRSRFDDPDMWWHLRMGQVIFTSHTVPATDIFSFTTNHHSWIPHEWLSQLTIFLAFRAGGLSGMMLWLCLFTSALYIAGYVFCGLYSGNFKVAFLGSLAVFVFSTVGVAIRPQLIGYLLLILELILIHLGRTRSSRWFWMLPPLFALWINCHGSFFLGIVLAGIFLFSSFFSFQAGSLVANRWPAATRRTFLWAMLLSLAALFLNPIGLKLILYPADTFVHQPLGLSSVQEWQPLQLTSQRGVLLLLVLASIVLLAIARKSELYFDELLLLAAALWLAGSHDRMLFVFGILAAPILTRMLSTSWETYDPATDRPGVNALLIVVAFAVVWFAFPRPAALAQQSAQNSPVQAVEYIKAHQLSGPMLNDYAYGGYLMWAMPEHPVFIDGRGDVYEWTGVLSEYMNWSTLNSDPNALLDKYRIQFCILDSRSPMVRILPLLHTWKIVYSDQNAAVLIRNPHL